MTALEEEKQHYTFEEYLALEEEKQLRYQYYNGEVFMMAGSTKRHNRITNSVYTHIDEQIAGKPCDVFTENIKLEFQAKNYYVYPDVMLTCDKSDLEDDTESIIRNPILVVEVLSNSTASYDANEKKNRYFALPSLLYYILISQETPLVEVYEREQDFWKYISYKNLEDTILLDKINIQLKVSDIYKKISFEENKGG